MHTICRLIQNVTKVNILGQIDLAVRLLLHQEATSLIVIQIENCAIRRHADHSLHHTLFFSASLRAHFRSVAIPLLTSVVAAPIAGWGRSARSDRQP